MGGFGELTTGSINFQGAGGITATSGSLHVNGTISAGSLLVNTTATFGGLGTWSFSGPVVFQSGSTFLVTLNGTAAGSQYTQLVDTNATSGVNLGFSTLAASIGYSYEESDLFTVIRRLVVQNAFANVIGGQAILDGVPFAVSTGQTAVKLAPLQSVTSTGSPARPGRATRAGGDVHGAVSTRTAPVPVGTVSFMQGSTVVATLPLNDGTAIFATIRFRWERPRSLPFTIQHAANRRLDQPERHAIGRPLPDCDEHLAAARTPARWGNWSRFRPRS